MNFKKFFNRYRNEIETVGARGTIYGREIGEYHFMKHRVGVVTDELDLNTIVKDMINDFIGHFKSFKMEELILELKDGRIVKWTRASRTETPVTGMSLLKAMGCMVRY